MILSSYQVNGWEKVWEIRPDTTDLYVLHEIWLSDTYQLKGVKGTVLDIGANIGSFAIRALQEGADKVFCYEPEPSNLEVLNTNCSNEIGCGKIVLDTRAVWSHDNETVKLVPLGGGTAIDSNGTIEVKTISLDTILKSIEVIDLLKMDVEGAEIQIINACNVDLLKRCKRLAMEYHGSVPEWGTMIRKLSGIFDMRIFGHDVPESGGMIFGINRHDQ